MVLSLDYPSMQPKSASNRIKQVKGKKISPSGETIVQDVLTTEKLLQISINGNPFTMTMRTPGDDKELTRGLLHAEQATGNLDVFRYTVDCIDGDGDVQGVQVLLDEAEKGTGISKKRSLVSSSSCGICGMEDAESVKIEGDPLQYEEKISAKDVLAYFRDMAEQQALFQDSGGCHAAAVYSKKGSRLAMYEDIGRHNAVDKCIGHLLLEDVLDEALILLVSGRVSFEIIQKAFYAGIPFLAAISAPSSLAVQLAQDKGITLAAFCREDKLTVYSNVNRILA
jgi:FdhD protein